MFNILLTIPLTNLLVFLYNTIAFQDLGIAIILFVFLIKIILFPLSKKMSESQAKMQELQPKIKEIQEKYKDNKEEQSKALMEIWKENKANPLGGCLPTLIQLPVIFAIFRLFEGGLPEIKGILYPFILNPGQLKPTFLNFLNLSSRHILPLAVIAGILQYFQIKLTMPKISGDAGGINMKFMPIIFPLIGAYVAYTFSAALGLYWAVFTAFSIAEHFIIKKLEKQKIKTAKE